MFGSSQVRNEVFVFKKNKISRIIMPKLKISTIILPLSELNRDQLKQIRAQQGKFAEAQSSSESKEMCRPPGRLHVADR